MKEYYNSFFINQKKGESTVWNKIIQRNSGKNIWVKEAKFSFPLRDMYKQLRGQEVTFNLNVEISPRVGVILYVNLNKKKNLYSKKLKLNEQHVQ